MHNHDLDLIAAYADGLPEVDAGRARALIDTCGICRDEYEAQRAVRSWLQEPPPAGLDVAERHRLRGAVLESIGGGTPVVDLAKMRMRRWVAVGSVAAALMVMVGLGNILSSPRVSETATDLETTVEMSEGDAGEEMATSEALRAQLSPESSVVALGDVDLETLRVEIDTLREAFEVAGSDSEDTAQATAALPAFEPSCVAELETVPYQIITATVDGIDVEVFLIIEGDYLAALAMVANGCAPFALDQ